MRAVNLLPQDARGRAAFGGFKPRPAHAVALVLFLLAVMALLYGQARNNVQKAESEAVTVRTEIANVERASAKDVSSAVDPPTGTRSSMRDRTPTRRRRRTASDSTS